MSAFKIMTFNVKGAFFDDGDNNWVHRWPLTVGTIRQCAPDVIGFQEVQPPNQATLAAELNDYDFELGPETARENSTGHGYHNAIYWNPARFEKLAVGGFFLSQTPQVYSRHWEAREVRGVSWVKLRDTETGSALLFLNSHFPHASEWARTESARLVGQQIPALRAGDNLPVAVTADFNSRACDNVDWDAVRELPDGIQHWIETAMPPANTVYKIFVDEGFRDTFLAAGGEDASTVNSFHRFLGRDFPPLGYRIDWILTLDGAQRWQTHACEIVHDEAPPLYPSDHYPVLAELELAN